MMSSESVDCSAYHREAAQKGGELGQRQHVGAVALGA